MSDINLARIFIQTDGDEHRQQARRARTIIEAFASDGRLKASALTAVLPWQRLDFRIPGLVEGGAGQGGIFPVPQGAIIRHIAAHTRVAPSTNTLAMQITGADHSERISLPAGTSTYASGANIPAPPGATLRLDILSDSGAEDLTVTLHYQSGIGGA